MKKIQILFLLIVIQFCNAQEYKKINSSTISYTRNSLFSTNSIVITNSNNSKLSEGFYEMPFKKTVIKFYISKKGNVDGVFKEYGSDGLLGCKTILKEGILEKVVHFDSNGKTTDSLQIISQDIERYDKSLKKWVMKKSLIYSNYGYFENGAVFEKSYGCNEGIIKTISYYKNGKIWTDENNFNYTKHYDSLGSLTKEVNYNWITKEIHTTHYENEKPKWKTTVFDENKIWNTNGTVIENNKINNSNYKNKSYKIYTDYYPNGKIQKISSNEGILKEYTEQGVLIERKFTEPIVMMADDTEEKENNIENAIYQLIEVNVKPNFPNGIDTFYTFFNENFIKPGEVELKGKIYLSFVIEKDGSLKDIKSLRDIGYGTGTEAIRVLKLSPKWIPAERNEEKVRSIYYLTFPIK